MGKHDREHQGDGAWPKDKPLPKDDVRDDWKDDGEGRHSTGKQNDDKQDDDT